MPDDFIPLHNNIKSTTTDRSPLEDRFRNIAALDRRQPHEHGNYAGISMEEFKAKLLGVRKAVVKWGYANVEAYFVQGMCKKFPDKFISGRKIESTGDCVEIIKKGPWDRDLMMFVHYAMYEVWGDGNQFAVNLEVLFCEIFRISFTGFKSDGKPPTKSHKGKCIAKLMVKCKNTLNLRLRSACKNRWHEGIYLRNESVKDTPGNGKSPKLIGQINATVEDYGFHGKLGIYEGSTRKIPDIRSFCTGGPAPSVITRESGTSDMSPLTFVSQTGTSNVVLAPDLHSFLQATGGGTLSKKELLARLLAEAADDELAILAALAAGSTSSAHHEPQVNISPAADAAQDAVTELAQVPPDLIIAAAASHDSNESEQSIVPAEYLVPPPANHVNPSVNLNDEILVWFPEPGRWYIGEVKTKNHPKVYVHFVDNTKTWVHVNNNMIKISEENDTSK